MKTLLLIPIILLTLAGCREDGVGSSTGFVKYEVEADGCVIKYVDNPKGYNFFIAKCPGASETITNQRPTGKSSTTDVTVTTNEVASLKERLRVAEAREAALGKLTEDERKALGIK